MNVSLTPEIEEWIHDKVQSGFYQSSSEVVRDALRLLRDYELLRADALDGLRSELLTGLADLDAGRAQPFDDTVLNNIKQRARKRAG